MSALAAASKHVKSQEPVAVEKRLERLRANPDYLLLCHAKDKRIAELEARGWKKRTKQSRDGKK
jgi:hypothetical protein